MARDHTEEWPDERLRALIEKRLDVFEQAVIRLQKARAADKPREEVAKAEDWVLGSRDSLVEWVYDHITGTGSAA